jgi:hypothetical protein
VHDASILDFPKSTSRIANAGNDKKPSPCLGGDMGKGRYGVTSRKKLVFSRVNKASAGAELPPSSQSAIRLSFAKPLRRVTTFQSNVLTTPPASQSHCSFLPPIPFLRSNFLACPRFLFAPPYCSHGWGFGVTQRSICVLPLFNTYASC